MNMMPISEETLRTLLWLAAYVFTVQALAFYAVVKLLVTGSGFFVRRERDEEEPRRIHAAVR
jgi:hypothetical protein